MNETYNMKKPHSNFIDLSGKRFGRWVVLSRSENVRHIRSGIVVSSNATWLCKCDCGTERVVNGCTLRRGESNSCGCLDLDTKRERLRAQTGEKHPFFIKDRRVAAVRQIICHYKEGAIKRGLSFDLTIDEFSELIGMPCYYCGQPPSNINGVRAHKTVQVTYSGLDRIDNSIGYTIKNVVPCCRTCNIAKRDMQQKDFLDWAKRVYEHNFWE
jgi:hypothetical protein